MSKKKTQPPRAKGGFRDNPQNINRKGRPPKGYSITEMMREMLDSKPEVKEAIGKVIAKKALEGDLTAIKTLWQYMDGMPQQRIEHSGGVNLQELTNDELDNTLKSLEGGENTA